ncbi:MAG TPA: V-type ATPase 116kDa subunit family protein [Oculatellaceae cyanobacterium]
MDGCDGRTDGCCRLEWIPQFLFLTCTFGYMIFLIVYKFCIDWARKTNGRGKRFYVMELP